MAKTEKKSKSWKEQVNDWFQSANISDNVKEGLQAAFEKEEGKKETKR